MPSANVNAWVQFNICIQYLTLERERERERERDINIHIYSKS